MIQNLNSQQKKVLKDLLHTNKNLFISGSAGAGKSYVLQMYRDIQKMQNIQIPMVASTGVAALLVNGITFNSYFGLGILAGGTEKTIENAIKNKTLCERIVYTDAIIIDEVSMISATTFRAANLLCQKIRQNNKLFGGIRIIAVGDFYQLGPFSEGDMTDWIFIGDCWKNSDIKQIQLSEVMRTKEARFLNVLNKVRYGIIDAEVMKFLNSRIIKPSEIADFNGPRIFANNNQVDKYNIEKLSQILEPEVKIATLYSGSDYGIKKIKDTLIVSETLIIKKGALVMLRVNNFGDGYVNGTLGHILKIDSEIITIKKTDGEIIKVKKHVFELRDGAGEIIAKAKIFPLTLAWAMTIHKSQGASLDSALISLENLWLHGQAYTALSRLKNSSNLFITGWDMKSFVVDIKVLNYSKKKE